MDHSASTNLRLARAPADASELAALQPLFEQGKRADLSVLVVASPRSDEANRALAKRRHDIKAALRTLGFTLAALESGYRFNDDKAAAKIDAIAKAVQVLERECELTLQVLTPN